MRIDCTMTIQKTLIKDASEHTSIPITTIKGMMSNVDRAMRGEIAYLKLELGCLNK